MRILQLTHKPAYPPVDGGCIAMQKVMEGFLRLRRDVDVLTLSTFKHPYNPSAYPSHDGLRVFSTDVDLRTKALEALRNLTRRESYIMERFEDDRVREQLNNLLAQNHYEVIWIESIFWLPYLDQLQGSGIPLVLRSHNIEHRIWRELAFKAGFPRSAYLKLLSRRLGREERMMWNGVEQIYSISPEDQIIIERETSTPVFNLPMSVSGNEIAAQPSKPFECHHLGAMDWIPNQEGMRWFLDDVWPMVRRKEAQSTFHLGGRRMTPEFLNWKAPGVQVHGEVDEPTKFRAEHGVLVVPLFSGSGLRIKILEALSEGIPVLATSKAVEGLPHLEQSGIMVSDEPRKWVKYLVELWHRPEEGQKLAQKGMDYVQHHFGEPAVDELLLRGLAALDKP